MDDDRWGLAAGGAGGGTREQDTLADREHQEVAGDDVRPVSEVFQREQAGGGHQADAVGRPEARLNVG
jgi:hypothetical protein